MLRLLERRFKVKSTLACAWYDHRFTAIGAGETEIAFLVDAEGFGAGLFGRLLAAIYARNLDRALPHLVREIEEASERI